MEALALEFVGLFSHQTRTRLTPNADYEMPRKERLVILLAKKNTRNGRMTSRFSFYTRGRPADAPRRDQSSERTELNPENAVEAFPLAVLYCRLLRVRKHEAHGSNDPFDESFQRSVIRSLILVRHFW